MILTGRWQDHLASLDDVRMVYADPPYGTGRTFSTYRDSGAKQPWVAELETLVTGAKDVLVDGVLWVHTDENKTHVVRTVGDTVFGANRHLGTIVWQRNTAGRGGSTRLVRQYDTICGWSVGDFALRPIPKSDYSQSLYGTPDGDSTPWRRDTLAAQGPGADFGITNPITGTVHRPPEGYHWRWKIERTADALAGWGRWKIERDMLVPCFGAQSAQSVQDAGPWPLVFFGTDGTGKPQRKSYWSDGSMASNLWLADQVGTAADGSRQVKKALGRRAFDTAKPLGLMERLVSISTDAGDLVVDPYAGSGTTGVAAKRLGRRYALIEEQPEVVDTIIIPRLEASM